MNRKNPSSLVLRVWQKSASLKMLHLPFAAKTGCVDANQENGSLRSIFLSTIVEIFHQASRPRSGLEATPRQRLAISLV